MTDDELRKAILEEAEESDIGEALLEGWQLGIYDATLEVGEVAWRLSEKGEALCERGEVLEFLERETREIDIEPTTLRNPQTDA